MFFGLFGKKKKDEGKGVCIGKIVHFFPHVKAAIIKVEKGTLSIGDKIRIKGHTTDIEQEIKSMQIEHEVVEQVSKGQEVAVKIVGKARKRDKVYLIAQ